MATTFTGLPPVQAILYQMTPDYFFTHNKTEANILAKEGTTLVPSRQINQLLHFTVFHDARLYTVTLFLLDLLSCSGAFMLFHSTVDLVEVFASVAIPATAALIPQQLSFPSRYALRQEEFCASQDCHHFSLKICTEAAHRSILNVIVRWSINNCTISFANSWPFVNYTLGQL